MLKPFIDQLHYILGGLWEKLFENGLTITSEWKFKKLEDHYNFQVYFLRSSDLWSTSNLMAGMSKNSCNCLCKYLYLKLKEQQN